MAALIGGGWFVYERARLAPIFWDVSTSALPVQSEQALKPGGTFKECASCPEMVVVPAGGFMMGSPANEAERNSDEGPQHRVTIARPFAIGKFEITFDEWDACVAHGGCKQEPDSSSWGRGRLPVINVSWDDAEQYVAWIAKLTGKPYRLLTEAEWEYAARAGNPGRFSFGDDKGKLGEHAWYVSNSRGKTEPVGNKKANAFGLHDMQGNVGEWVEDCYHDSYKGAPTDGSAWSGECNSRVVRRVVRGGAWNYGDLRSARRDRYTSVIRYDSVGFRVGRTLTP